MDCKVGVFCLPKAMELHVLLRIVWHFYTICTFVFANHGLIFVLVKMITTVMVLRHLLFVHLTNFEFVDVA